MAKFKLKNKEYQLNVKANLAVCEKLDKQQLDTFTGKMIRGFLKVKQTKKRAVDYYGTSCLLHSEIFIK